MRFKVISVGAAGNKAGINLVEKGIIEKDDLVLINSTIKDIPVAYRDLAIRLSDQIQGCGQERSIGISLCTDAIRDKRLNLDSMLEPVHDKAIIITSTCGGTGSGASVTIAKYLKFIGVDVEVIGLVGFEDESARSLRNFVEFCQDLDEGYVIQLIRNSAFLNVTRGNRTAAEIEANNEVARRIKVMGGSLFRDSLQNIDNTDIIKLNNTPGYKTVEYREVFDKIRNVDQFNQILTEMLDDSAMVEPDATGVGLLGVVANLQSSSQQFIDRSFKVLKDRLGMPYELYTHIEECPDLPEFIAIVASGMKMPAKEINNIFNKYTALSNAVNTKKDDFFENIQNLKGNSEDAMFDTNIISGKPKINLDDARKAFFKSMGE